ncbi:anti-sigma factor family protein [Thermobifida cellulosilytica]|uniref:Anti-sigma factor n=1 Tax=Thermobifida cellulosilytica TB100 TaxID=665004 RepID=A0A147KLM8_THECS|nr:hypothetical protein [Thermobifida cellulosilytica]KUP98212.1 hypothetical protein AC529_02780 [Thermobifida cellulosilytica TB100]
MTSHVDPETLALFAEGELHDKEREQEVRAWLAESEEARAQLAALREVTQILASTPVPPMPDGLVERIDEALRAEARKHPVPSGAPVVPLTPSDENAKVRPLRRSHGPARWTPFLVAAAAAVFVLGAGTAVLSSLFTSSDTTDSAVVFEQTSPQAALPYRLAVVSSGTDYTSDALADQGAELLGRSALSGSDGAAESEPLTPKADEAVPATVTSCVDALNEVYGAAPILVDLASYEGSPAWIMLFPAADNGHEIRVVQPDCGEKDDPASAVVTSAVLSNSGE